jgi:hypothetical protein
MSETYDIGLGNYDSEIRKKADSDFVSFGVNRQKISLGFHLGLKL